MIPDLALPEGADDKIALRTSNLCFNVHLHGIDITVAKIIKKGLKLHYTSAKLC
jgi:hypothetical protein